MTHAIYRVHINMKNVGERPRKPPMFDLLFDVMLRNDEAYPLWVLLPSKISAQAAPTTAGVNGVETFRYSGTGHVVTGKFLGTGGFQAIQLPAHGHITVRGLSITYIGVPPHETISLEVRCGRQLTIGGEPASAWIMRADGTDTKADTYADKAEKQERLGSRYTPDMEEVTAALQEEYHVKLQVTRKRQETTP